MQCSPRAQRSSTGSGQKPCAQSPLEAFSEKDWTLSTSGFAGGGPWQHN